MNEHRTSTPANPSGTGALRFDMVAGLTAAAVVLPKAMAYATVAGLPVAVGLYTAFIPMVIYALLGTSRVLSVSSTTTLAILAGAELGLVVPDGDAARLATATVTLTVLVGGALYRFDSYLVAYTPAAGWSYFPSVPELVMTIGLVSLEIFVFIVLVRKFPILSGTVNPAAVR